MKLEKLEESSMDEILVFISSTKNLVIGSENNLSNDFKNLLHIFARSKTKSITDVFCYVLRDESGKIRSVLIFNSKGEINIFCIDDLTDSSLGIECLKQLSSFVDAKEIPYLTAKVKDTYIGNLNDFGFKSVSFVNLTGDTSYNTNYYFNIRYKII